MQNRNTIESKWRLKFKEHATCMFVVEEAQAVNNEGFRKLLAAQKTIPERILWTGMWLSLATQWCPIASWDRENSLEHEN